MRLKLTGLMLMALAAPGSVFAQTAPPRSNYGETTHSTSSPVLMSGLQSEQGAAGESGQVPESALPPRIAQYPLEDDPYEAPPGTRGTNQYGATQMPSPQTSSPNWTAEPEVEPWLKWDNTQITGTYIHAKTDSVGWGDVVGKGTITFPNAPWLWLGPQGGVHILSSQLADIPEEVYDFSLEVTMGLPLNDTWTLSAAMSPGIFSDFSGAGGDEFRVPARLFAFYKWSDSLTLGAGYLYLARPDITGLPLVGLSYIPSDEFRAELWFPRPKVSKRYYKVGNVERWVYGVGEFGGGSWAIELDNGQNDSFAYRDYRLMLGVEQKCPEGFGWFVEGGVVFGRRITFDRSNLEQSLDGTSAMQAGVRF